MPKDRGAKRPVWLIILLAAIPAAAVVIAAYLQSRHKNPPPSQPKAVPYAGRVRDDQTGKPVHRAKVTVEEDQEPPQVQETDSEGYFQVRLSEADDDVHVVVEAPGYAGWDRVVSVKRSGLESIWLHPDGALTPTITPTPTPTPTPPPTPTSTPSPAPPATPSPTRIPKPSRRKSRPGGNCNAEDVLEGRCRPGKKDRGDKDDDFSTQLTSPSKSLALLPAGVNLPPSIADPVRRARPRAECSADYEREAFRLAQARGAEEV